MVAVAEVQLGEQRQAADDEAQRRVGDVQAGQPQLLHVAQLALVVQLACESGESDTQGSGSVMAEGVSTWRRWCTSNPLLNAAVLHL